MMFEDAADISLSEIKAYRAFGFPSALGDPRNEPYFSVENPTDWITSCGYQLYLLHDGSEGSVSSYQPEDASTKQLKAFRTYPPDALASHNHEPSPSVPAAPITKPKRKAKGKSDPGRIKITRELKVDARETLDKIPATWVVPRVPTVYYIDKAQITTKSGKLQALDAFIRSEDQESWTGSNGHRAGDVKVFGLTDDPDQSILCRRSQLYCNGVDACELADEDLFSGSATREFDATENEAASSIGVLARLYGRIVNSTCKVKCDGVPILVRLKNASSYGKKFFIGCSKWSRNQRFDHIYWNIPSNVDENDLRFVMENNGRLLTHMTENETSYTHVVDGRIIPAKITNRPCKTEMLIFIPVKQEHSHKAYVLLRNPHNHPAHPNSKPSAADRTQLDAAVQAAGTTALTVKKLLNAHSTATIYGGARVSEISPALQTVEGVDGEMDEWEVASVLDRYKHRLTFASLYCDRKTTESFTQLFTELFDTIRQVTGKEFQLAPFVPGAKCRVIIMDGEVPQALGLAEWIKRYNNPEVSGIWTRDTTKLLKYCLKTCNPHFERHIDELPMRIPRSVIMRLKSILGLSNQKDIDDWHEFCAIQTDEAIINWYAHKKANPWVLPSINKFLSSIKDEDWDITPVHSNYVETAHAGRNAETNVGVPILTAILQAQERDNIWAAEIAQVERSGVMRNRWNGPAEREKLSAQRRNWKVRKSAVRNEELASLDSLKAERDTGMEDNKESIQRSKILEEQIKALRQEMKIDKHRTDLLALVNELHADIQAELSLRREWTIRKTGINSEIEKLRTGGLAGARTTGRRPERPAGEVVSAVADVALEFDANLHAEQAEGTIDSAPESDANLDVEQAEGVSIGSVLGELQENSPQPLSMIQDKSHIDSVLLTNLEIDWNSVPVAESDRSFSAEMTLFEQTMLESNFNLEEFLASVDPSTLDFGTVGWGGVDEMTVTHPAPHDYNELEYISLPTIYQENNSVLVSTSNQSTALFPPLLQPGEMLAPVSQGWELPRLPPPPSSPSSAHGPEESPDSNLGNGQPDSGFAVGPAPLDIDLGLNVSNIISGKRQRKPSSRAINAATSKRAKMVDPEL
ncbi:hypothetical protein B0H12DRAFT_1303369 [Mycena haematopus]|nr:hypothetical protein B0H12DRAFT_1303369 [Mycena haematopus]